MLQRYKNKLGFAGKCEAVILPTTPPTVVLMERADNLGPTVGSTADTIATSIFCEHLAAGGHSAESIRWLEFIPASKGREEQKIELTFEWTGSAYASPRRKPTTAEGISFVTHRASPISAPMVEISLTSATPPAVPSGEEGQPNVEPSAAPELPRESDVDAQRGTGVQDSNTPPLHHRRRPRLHPSFLPFLPPTSPFPNRRRRRNFGSATRRHPPSLPFLRPPRVSRTLTRNAGLTSSLPPPKPNRLSMAILRQPRRC